MMPCDSPFYVLVDFLDRCLDQSQQIFKDYAIPEMNFLIWLSLFAFTGLLLRKLFLLFKRRSYGCRIPGQSCPVYGHFSAADPQRSLDVLSQNLQPQVHNKGQSVSLQMVPNQSRACQKILAQNIQNNTHAEQQPSIDGIDWRSQLLPDSRQKIINKIMETLKKHLSVSGKEGLEELKKIAIRFEEKIYSAAISQFDYLRKISLKMLIMESKSQTTLSNANSTGVGRNPQDPVPSQYLQPQVHNQGQFVPLQMVPNQSWACQQILAQNIQNNLASAGMQTSASLPNSLTPVGSLTQNPMPNAAQNPNLQNISGISQNLASAMNQGTGSNLFTNSQMQMQGRQQQIGSQQQPQLSQNSQQFMYQQQLGLQMLKRMLQQEGSMQQPLMQTAKQQQRQQQNILQANQLQSSQQPINQTSSAMQPSMISGLQQNQQSSIQQPLQSVLEQRQQSQMPSQQQQLMGKQANTVNLQQNQLISHQNNISDMQQKQLRMLRQQNSLPNLPLQQKNNQQNLPQQHLVGQQSNLPNMHQEQFGHQNHMGGQQMSETQLVAIGMQTNQQSVHMMQQSKLSGQQQSHNTNSLLPSGGNQPQAELQSQQQLMSQMQSQPTQLKQQFGLQQQLNSLQHNMQEQRIQNPNPLLQQPNMIYQQKHLFQSQRAPSEAPSTSLDFTGTNGGDWQEEVYQKIKAMKDLYLADLREMHHQISLKLQLNISLPQPQKADQIEKLKLFKQMLERLMHFLQATKNDIVPTYRDKLPSFEKQIINLLKTNWPRKPVPSMQAGQVLSSQVQTMQHSQHPQAQSHEFTRLQHGSVNSL